MNWIIIKICKYLTRPKKIPHPAANLTSLLLESAVLQSLFPTHPDPPPSSHNHSQYQSPGNLSNQIIQTAVQQTINSGSALPLVNEQDRFLIDMLMFLAMLMLGLVVAGVITAMYMRAVKEKRESQVNKDRELTHDKFSFVNRMCWSVYWNTCQQRKSLLLRV